MNGDFPAGALVLLSPVVNDQYHAARADHRVSLKDKAILEAWTLENVVGAQSCAVRRPVGWQNEDRYLDFDRIEALLGDYRSVMHIDRNHRYEVVRSMVYEVTCQLV